MICQLTSLQQHYLSYCVVIGIILTMLKILPLIGYNVHWQLLYLAYFKLHHLVPTLKFFCISSPPDLYPVTWQVYCLHMTCIPFPPWNHNLAKNKKYIGTIWLSPRFASRNRDVFRRKLMSVEWNLIAGTHLLYSQLQGVTDVQSTWKKFSHCSWA